MGKNTENWLCTECGDNFPKWFGKCPSCRHFNTLKAFRESKVKTTAGGKVESGTDLTSHVSKGGNPSEIKRIPTCIDESDRDLGGGFFPGSVKLFGGHPGIGKSTLSLQIFANIPDALYFSGEESVDQVLSRAQRLLEVDLENTGKVDLKSLENRVFSTNSLEDIITTIESQKPSFVIIDSIQMVGLAHSSFGTTSQIRENAEILIKLAKSSGTTMLIVGHVTKNDEIAGPKILEHLVDVVLYLEGERNSEIRLLRGIKNRFGSTLEVGVFEMQSAGLTPLANPSEFFLSERALDAHGSSICVIRDGARNFLFEIQVLTLKTNFGQPRRTAHGFDLSKFHLLLAVISKFTPFKCHEYDAYLNVVGGLKVTDPAADLAIMASILSSRAEQEIPADTIVMGEVGLSGEVRRITNLDARLHEAAKLGFKRVICPHVPKGLDIPKNLTIIEVKSVMELLKVLIKPRS